MQVCAGLADINELYANSLFIKEASCRAEFHDTIRLHKRINNLLTSASDEGHVIDETLFTNESERAAYSFTQEFTSTAADIATRQRYLEQHQQQISDF